MEPKDPLATALAALRAATRQQSQTTDDVTESLKAMRELVAAYQRAMRWLKRATIAMLVLTVVYVINIAVMLMNRG